MKESIPENEVRRANGFKPFQDRQLLPFILIFPCYDFDSFTSFGPNGLWPDPNGYHAKGLASSSGKSGSRLTGPALKSVMRDESTDGIARIGLAFRRP